MKKIKIICPCCNNNLVVNIEDTGEISGVFFDAKEISVNEAFDKYGICLGMEGGERNVE